MLRSCLLSGIVIQILTNAENAIILQVAALKQRRSVTFMNNFLINTSNFLNNFSVIAEENLAKQTREMEKLEIAVNILETKV